VQIKRLIAILIPVAIVISPLFYDKAFTANKDEGGISSDVREGIVCFAHGELEQAIKAFTSAIKKNPKDYPAYFQRAQLYEHMGKTSAAIKDYTEIINTCPEYSLRNYSYYYRGRAYQKKGMLAEAMADCSTLIEIREASDLLRANAYNNRGLAYNTMLYFDNAIRDYFKAMELIPDLKNVYYNCAVSYLNKGLYDTALSYFHKELKFYPGALISRRYISAITYYKDKNYRRSWYEVFQLRQRGEKVSLVFVEELKRRAQEARHPTSNGFLRY
jgi:tetratricopeptide (TPR) repeat protein